MWGTYGQKVSVDQCIECGKSDKPHFNQGMCKSCYYKVWSKNNLQKKRETALKSYHKNKLTKKK